MIVLSFISMYMLMYAMVNTLGDVYDSLNQVYMAHDGSDGCDRAAVDVGHVQE